MAAQPKEEDQALALLTSELGNQGNQLQVEAEGRVMVANADANMNQTYTNLVGRIPQGSRVVFQKNVNIIKDDATGDSNVTLNKPASPQPIIPPMNQVQVANELHQAQQNPTMTFDVEKAIVDINKLNGEEKGVYTLQLLSKIDTAFATRAATLRQQSMRDAGVVEAEAAVKRFSDMARLKHIDPSQAVQVVNAQAVVTQALAAANAKSKLLLESDAELVKLTGSRNLINTLMQKQINSDTREQAIVDIVPENAVLNHNIIYGTTGDGFKDRLATAKLAQKDAVFKVLSDFDYDTAAGLLTHPDARVRGNSLKLLIERDKRLNPYDPHTGKGIQPDATSTPVSKLVENLLQQPIATLLEKTYTDKKEREKVNAAYLTASSKEKEVIGANIRNVAIHTAVQNAYVASWTNAKGWIGTTVAPDQPLGKTIQTVAAANKGVADMDSVIKAFIQDKTILGADGKPLDFPNRIAILSSTISNTSTAEQKSILMRDPQAVKDKVLNQVKNTAAKHYATLQTQEAYDAYYRQGLGKY